MLERLVAYLDSVKARDPAPRSRWEVLTYPGVWAVGYHRIAHWLFEAELFFLARLVNHWSRMFTAIDIHPGAKIGKNFFGCKLKRVWLAKFLGIYSQKKPVTIWRGRSKHRFPYQLGHQGKRITLVTAHWQNRSSIKIIIRILSGITIPINDASLW